MSNVIRCAFRYFESKPCQTDSFEVNNWCQSSGRLKFAALMHSTVARLKHFLLRVVFFPFQYGRINQHRKWELPSIFEIWMNEAPLCQLIRWMINGISHNRLHFFATHFTGKHNQIFFFWICFQVLDPSAGLWRWLCLRSFSPAK